NVMGDFIQTPGTDAFDAVHTSAVVRSTLTMYQRALSVGQPTPVQLPWQWNTGTNADNDLKLSEVGTEVHAIWQVFTGGEPDARNRRHERPRGRQQHPEPLHLPRGVVGEPRGARRQECRPQPAVEGCGTPFRSSRGGAGSAFLLRHDAAPGAHGS